MWVLHAYNPIALILDKNKKILFSKYKKICVHCLDTMLVPRDIML